MSDFVNVSSVQPGVSESWEGRILLTFDLDWAADTVIADTIDMVESADVAATWFVTHPTPILQRLRANPKFELGIHPNFLPLLNGRSDTGRDAEEVIDLLLAIVPEAKTVRSHSLVQSGRLLELFQKKGMTHDGNSFIPLQSDICLRPWIDWFGMIRVPYFWEDDFHCGSVDGVSVGSLLNRSGMAGFDFHPIHVFLNTENLDRYEKTRALHRSPDDLIRHRYAGAGVRGILTDLLRQANAVIPAAGISA